jgi:hypothetical protein
VCGNKKGEFFEKKYPECFQNKKIETNLKKSIDKLFKNCFEAIAQMSGLSGELYNIEERLKRTERLQAIYQKSFSTSIQKVKDSLKITDSFNSKDVIDLIDSIDDLVMRDFHSRYRRAFQFKNQES